MQPTVEYGYLLAYELVCALMARGRAWRHALGFKGTLQLFLAFEQQLRFGAGARTKTAHLLGAISVLRLTIRLGRIELHAIKRRPAIRKNRRPIAATLSAWGYSGLPSYRKEILTRARNSMTLLSAIRMSSFSTSAMRKSRTCFPASSTAVFAASSHEFVLEPMTWMIL
jgi:hypothetical protein